MNMELVDILSYAGSILFSIIIIGTMYVIITENRNPIKSIAWVLVLAMLPIVGFIFYLFFGKNYRKRKMISKNSIKRIKKKHPKHELTNIPEIEGVNENNIGIINLLYKNNQSFLYEKNEVEVYTNGEDAFESVFSEIEKATKNLHVQFFIVENDIIGNRLRELLIKKAQEGVKVKFIYDGLGSFYLNKQFLTSLKEAGVETASFLPVHFPFLSNKVNYRNHRKLVIIDGLVGFVGGMNVADRYISGNELGKWRDTLIKIEGHAVHGLQNSFLIDWFFVSRTLISSTEYYPKSITKGNKLIQIASSGPDSDWESILQSFCKIISSAKKYVYLQTPYFLPPESLLSSIKIAALSGVDVRLVISENSDAKFTNTASRSYLREIMDAGVKVYFYNKGFVHSKTIVSDDYVSTIGSTNLDFRSFEQHFEINAFIYNKDFAVKMKEIYEIDLKSSIPVGLKKWKKREKWEKFKESIARLFSPLL